MTLAIKGGEATAVAYGKNHMKESVEVTNSEANLLLGFLTDVASSPLRKDSPYRILLKELPKLYRLLEDRTT